ncbi:hypothetical protein PGUG_01532 [Meyerozyma guilliermondii ATCC 6260]|uniref:6-phosphofructo-2-kinase domain-containing protein n=1 Tax=Meyerozyma guilliermondii (strain ATCC 6260 / CBS 566 / DSM 6381 / JCM 1539 / NBRC 10279 / NRRL Y-324) TaxID=294746 RepID=A5DE31_PICGU|nr:uncharacterized protein PGUG_01532 [Meyerozyma guilliermondii ATCC 6260]EDK37434.2 hypothetical protein PGUG_01532 [Meyerozyma guilliermondii ATCC 6260]
MSESANVVSGSGDSRKSRSDHNGVSRSVIGTKSVSFTPESSHDNSNDNSSDNFSSDSGTATPESGPLDHVKEFGSQNKHSHLRTLSSSGSSQVPDSLTKLQTYPYTGEAMQIGRSIDTQLDASNLSNSSLPEFNKRPLTDTPIVSGTTSPITQDHSSDDDKEEEPPKKNDTEPLKKSMKNISHLNLSDLHERNSSGSISPHTVLPDSNAKPAEEFDPDKTIQSAEDDLEEPTPENHNDEHPNERTTSPSIKITDQTRAELLQDAPPELHSELDDSPSIEKLKSLLLKKPPPPARKTYTLNIPGQTSSKTSPDGRIASVDVGSKLVIVMVGLPARGKSYITNKLTRYLNWLQHDCRVFNVGNTRRNDKVNNVGPENQPLPDSNTPNNEKSTPSPETHPKSPQHGADFFNPENKNSNAIREKWAMDTLDQLLDYVINGSGSVGIFDATNSTKSRRSKVLRKINQRSNGELKVLFLESVCSDPAIIESNIRLKLSGPDYRDMDPELALEDFVGRLHNYEKAYETIDEEEEALPGFQYVKMIDVGKKVVSYNIQGFLASQTVYFLLNFNLAERQIWITRHGESVDNLSGRIGGDSHLTKRGRQFSRALARFLEFQRHEFRKQQLERFSSRLHLRYSSTYNKDRPASLDNIPTEPNFCVWTSMLHRAVESGEYFNENLFSIKEMRMLNELGGGKFEGLTYDEIQKKYPKEFQARLRNKLTYRYPGVGGESYLDVLTRLRPLITEIERTTDHLLLISHRVVLRILLAYFLNLDRSSIGELDVPLHTLYCLESKPYGTDYRMYEYDEGLDWFVKVEPEHQKNLKEVGVQFKERKYSVVPTAPPSSKSRDRAPSILQSGQGTQLRRSVSHSEKETPKYNMSFKKLADLNRMRKPNP